MKIEELIQKTKQELDKTLKELREKLQQLRFDLAAGKIKNVKEIRDVRKNIAKVLTILNKK